MVSKICQAIVSCVGNITLLLTGGFTNSSLGFVSFCVILIIIPLYCLKSNPAASINSKYGKTNSNRTAATIFCYFSTRASATGSAGWCSGRAVPAASSRVHSLWSSTSRYWFCTQLWGHKHYYTAPYNRRGRVPGLPRRHP